MKVRICEPIAGLPEPRYGLGLFSFSPGEIVELHDELAAAWLDSGIAAPIEAEKRGKKQPKVVETVPADQDPAKSPEVPIAEGKPEDAAEPKDESKSESVAEPVVSPDKE